MAKRMRKSITVRMAEGDYLEMESFRLQFEPNLKTSTYYREIITGRLPHPYFKMQVDILDDFVLRRMDALDMYMHYAGSAFAAEALKIPGDRFIQANKEVFEKLEAQMRGYTFDNETGVRTPLPKDYK